jgi:uncharacterized protein YgiM (DUF1202 family)
MKAILIDEQVPVYASMEDETISIATLHQGDEMDLGKVSQKKKKTWVEITLSGGQKGYILGDTKIFAVRKAVVARNPVDMVDGASGTAHVIKTLIKGTNVTAYGVEKNDDGSWFKVRDDSGTEGFIPTSAKLRVIQEVSRANATRNLVTGLIFVVIGIFLTISNTNSAAGESMLLISYAVIFFGLLQMGQGVVEYVRASRAKSKPENK